MPLCAETAGGAGADPPDRGGSGAPAPPAALARWDDGRRVRPRRVSGAAGGARAAPAHQPDLVTACWDRGRPGGLKWFGVSHPWMITMWERRTRRAGEADPAETARRQARGHCWASLMARTFGLDVLACPRCGGRLRLIALIEEPVVNGSSDISAYRRRFLLRVPPALRHAE